MKDAEFDAIVAGFSHSETCDDCGAPASGRIFCTVCDYGGSFCDDSIIRNLVLIAMKATEGYQPICPSCGSEALGIEVIRHLGEEGDDPLYRQTAAELGFDPGAH